MGQFRPSFVLRVICPNLSLCFTVLGGHMESPSVKGGPAHVQRFPRLRLSERAPTRRCSHCATLGGLRQPDAFSAEPFVFLSTNVDAPDGPDAQPHTVSVSQTEPA